MTTLTDRELEFLASLKADWGRLYRIELARLLKGERNNSTYHNSHYKLPEDFPCFGSRYSLQR